MSVRSFHSEKFLNGFKIERSVSSRDNISKFGAKLCTEKAELIRISIEPAFIYFRFKSLKTALNNECKSNWNYYFLYCAEYSDFFIRWFRSSSSYSAAATLRRSSWPIICDESASLLKKRLSHLEKKKKYEKNFRSEASVDFAKFYLKFLFNPIWIKTHLSHGKSFKWLS